jgi:hypothetical protein
MGKSKSKLNLTKAFYEFAPYRMSKLWGSVAISVSVTLDPDFSESHLSVNGRTIATLRLDKRYSEITLSLDFREIGYRHSYRKLTAEILDSIVKGSEKYLGVKLNTEVSLDIDDAFLIVVKNESSKTIFRERLDYGLNEIVAVGSLKLVANAYPFIPYSEDPELEQLYNEFRQLNDELQRATSSLSPERARIIEAKLRAFSNILSTMNRFDWRGVWLDYPNTKVEEIKERARDAIAVLQHIILPKAKELLAEEKILS